MKQKQNNILLCLFLIVSALTAQNKIDPTSYIKLVY